MSDATAPDPALEEMLRQRAEALGCRVTRIDWLEGQLGLRRFARLHVSGAPFSTLVARIDSAEDPASRPAGIPPEPPLEPIRALLEAEGLPVPRRLGGDPGARLDLLEDVGSQALRDVARTASPPERRALYEEACDLVPRIQRVTRSDVDAFRRRLDATLLAYKAEVFLDHALAGAGPATAEAVRDAFRRVAGAVGDAPARLAHRDFQSANLHVRPGAPAGARLVMIDLQGAFLAPPEYDLVCLLRDSYVELGADEVAHQAERVRPALPDAPDPESFARRFDLLTLVRKGKDLGRFLYAARVRGDRRFLACVPATVRALRAAAERSARRDPGLRSLAEIVAALPEEPAVDVPETPCGR